MSEAFVELGEAINDSRFVEVDLALRRGQHIDRDDAESYGYLLDARNVLEPFYSRYACELVHRTDGYFFLLPLGEKVPRRLLGIPEMIVGQAAALLYLDPSTIERGGVLTKDDILSHLAAIMGTDALVAAFNPKRKRMDERVAQETVRQRTSEALRKLAQLGFVSQLEDGHIRLRGALMRFADPVRGAGSPREALEKLIARGEIALPADADAGEEQSFGANAHGATLAHGDDPDVRADEDEDDERFDDDENSDDLDSVADVPDRARSDVPIEQTGSTSDHTGVDNRNKPTASLHDGFTFDSEFPLDPEHPDAESEDEFAGDDVERSDEGEALDDDDVDHDSAAPRPPKAKKSTESAEWDPTFDDFD